MGLIVDSGILIRSERAGETVAELLRTIKNSTGDSAVAISAVTVMELAHGLWRADSAERFKLRRAYLDEVRSAIRVQPFTADLAELAARIDAESRKSRQVIPLADLQIGVTAVALGYGIATVNRRHFGMIPNLRIVEL